MLPADSMDCVYPGICSGTVMQLRGWDAASASWQATVEMNAYWRRCPADRTIALIEEKLELLGGLDPGRGVALRRLDALASVPLAPQSPRSRRRRLARPGAAIRSR